MTLLIITIFLSALPLFISLTNIILVGKLKEEELRITKPPLLSILIPARNEAGNIGKLLSSLSIQDYPKFEIIVLDDNSTDSTVLVAEQFINENERGRIIKGKPLKDGWKGKNWACWQLYKAAKGDELFYIDADVELTSKSALSSIMNYYAKKDVRFLSVLPRQEINSLGERLVVPNLYWMLFSYLPFLFVKIFKKPGFSAAIGTSILINKELYKKIDGHKAVKDIVTEDVALARVVKRIGERVEVARGYELLKTRMYASFVAGFKGLARSFFPAIDRNYLLAIFIILIFMSGAVLPWILFFRNAVWILHILLIFLNGFLVDRLTGEKKGANMFFYPFQRFILFFLMVYSILFYSLGSVSWKDRPL